MNSELLARRACNGKHRRLKHGQLNNKLLTKRGAFRRCSFLLAHHTHNVLLHGISLSTVLP